MRVIAARSRKGDDWGVIFEVVQGDLLEGPKDEIRWPGTIQQYRYGSRVPRQVPRRRAPDRHASRPPDRLQRKAFTVPASFDGIRIVGPKGTKPFELTDALVRS